MTKAVPHPSTTRRGRAFFEREVSRLMDRLYGTALQLTRDPDNAEDVVADAVAKAWAKLDQLRDADRFEGWLFRILHHSFISHWRRQCSQRHREEVLDADDLEVADFSLFEKLHQPFLLWWGTPETAFVNQLLREDIERALASLPDVFRLAVVLVDIEGYSYEETAELLDVPKGTVRSRLNRARRLLQRELWQQGCDAGLISGPQKGTPTEGGGR